MIGAGVVIGKGTVVRDSIIMKDTKIGDNCTIDKAIIAEDCEIGNDIQMGIGESAVSKLHSEIYAFDLVTVGENSHIPSNVKIGKNTAICGKTDKEDYPDGMLAGGEYIIKAGEGK